MRNYSRYRYNKKIINKKNFGLTELILNQCMICSLVLVCVLILNIVPEFKSFRNLLSTQLAQNISLDSLDKININPRDIKTNAINIIEPLLDYFSSEQVTQENNQEDNKNNQHEKQNKQKYQEDYLIDKNLLDQMQEENKKYEAIKKNYAKET